MRKDLLSEAPTSLPRIRFELCRQHVRNEREREQRGEHNVADAAREGGHDGSESSLEGDELALKAQSRVRWDRSRAILTITELSGDQERALATDAHRAQALVPTLDDFACTDLEGEGRTAISRIEHFAVRLQLTHVVHFDDIALLWELSAADLGVEIAQAGGERGPGLVWRLKGQRCGMTHHARPTHPREGPGDRREGAHSDSESEHNRHPVLIKLPREMEGNTFLNPYFTDDYSLVTQVLTEQLTRTLLTHAESAGLEDSLYSAASTTGKIP